MNMKNWVYICVFAFIGFASCNKDQVIRTPIEQLDVPQGFPPIEFPEDNAYSLKRWELGKRLFNDPILSIDSTLSCGSCHKPHLAFADDVAFSPGVKNRPGTRNAPTLTNVAYNPYFLSEGGIPTLEMQILVPIQEHNEFDHNIVKIAEALQKNPDYVELSNEAYGRDPDHFVITRAIANFERSMLSGNSPYDQFEKGNSSALSESAKRGKDLFMSKANCSHCHNGFNFTDYSFQNNGLSEHYADEGRMRLTLDSADLSTFKVPTLRNVEYSAPYMHNGQFNTLEEVVEHYNTGGADHRNKNAVLKPLQLSTQEKEDLVAFLKSLSDLEFMQNPKWQ
jgi:cytochrome c peroxidase